MKNFYITTSIAYTNAFPHIGFALESIQADVLARYHRSLGENVFFLTGTDEHGSKIARSAEKAGKDPQDFVDEISSKFKDLKDVLNISSDDFIRTTDKQRHWPAVEQVWKILKENGDIYKKKYKGLYCEGCEAFLQEKDLVDGKCPNHQKSPEVIEEENYFFKLSKYSERIEKLISEDEIEIIPKTRKNEILSFIKQGIEDISFSRLRSKLKWGIPVPNDDTQTIYVWCDALVNYISAIGYVEESKKFKKFWPANIHCVGKDIFRFHSLFWPAMLLSLDLEPPKKIFVHGFINVGGRKMSKSLGNVIDPFELVKKYGTDAVRYYLLREISPAEDGDFTYEKFEGRYNADLAKGLGNLTSRIITLSGKFETKPEPSILKEKIDQIHKEYIDLLDKIKFNKALISIWNLISFCDRYIEKEKIWENTEEKLSQINDLLFALQEIAKMIKPFLPKTSEEILEQIDSKKSRILFPKI